jgi:PleD family two-component response regulator
LPILIKKLINLQNNMPKSPEQFNFSKSKPKKEENIEKKISQKLKKEVKPSRFLFIDDNESILRSLKNYFSDNQNIGFAECHSVKEALEAIKKYQPDAIFLDHSLTEYGDEGLEIADQVKGIKIYSTTSNSSVAAEYQKRGIENISKTNLGKLELIITEGKNKK